MSKNHKLILILISLMSTVLSYLIVSGVLATLRTFSFFLTFERKPNRIGDILSLPLKSGQAILIVLLLTLVFFFLFLILYNYRIKQKELFDQEYADKFITLKDNSYGDSKFSTLKELENNDDFEITDSFSLSKGIVLGVLNNKTVSVNVKSKENYNTLVLGSSGGGKTQGFILPNIRNAVKRGDSFVAIDPKGEIFSQVQEHLSDYKIQILNLKNPEYSDHFDLFKYIDSRRISIVEFSNQLFENLGSKDYETFFIENAKSILSYLVDISMEFKNLRKDSPDIDEYSINGHKVGTFGYAYDLLLEYPESKTVKQHLDDLRALTLKYQLKESEFFRRLYDPGEKVDLLENFLSNLKIVLSHFFDRDIVKMFSIDDFDLTSLIKEKTALFIIMDESSISARNRLASVILNTIINVIETLKNDDFDETKYSQRLFFFLDEFGAIGTLKGLEDFISVCRSKDIGIIMALQGINQLENNYEKTYETILSNCRLKVGATVKGPSSLKFMSELLGNTTAQIRSKHFNHHESSESIQSQQRELMLKEEIENLRNKNVGKFANINFLVDQISYREEDRPVNTIKIQDYFKAKEKKMKQLEERRLLEADE